MKAACEGPALVARGDRTIIRCSSCGFVHAHPSYSSAELEAYYKDNYAESTPSPNWAEKVWNIERIKDGGKILDIGCWEGRQLEEFLARGTWSCEGTELNIRAANVARSKGIVVHGVSLDEFFAKFEGCQWDVINFAYVLEHLPDPVGILEKLRSHVAPDGLLVLEVPNEFNPFQLAHLRATGLEPYWIALPDHLNYFDKASLAAVADRAGYEVVRGETTFPMEMFLLMGENYLNNPPVGKAAFNKVVRMEEAIRGFDPSLLPRLYSLLYEAGIGRGLVLYLRPKART